MIANAKFIDSLAALDNGALQKIGEDATRCRKAAKSEAEVREFMAAELAVRLEMMGRVRKVRDGLLRSELDARAAA
ncbi:hypothetical protein PBI_HUFFY_37 [Gordonia phage Huffy]|uniref:Uncharacterized protein n=1 Tax=Gordonia phage TZGordon TaxID=2744004 RepID=A0A6N0A7W2_9CAUD|nr:hypothetical protein KDJ61_gp78 [Gordonia phage TZGordon]AQY55639.1 hypothetical protein PBI_HUFFY_37 [Gordonia phage Huffy]AQY55721.1 hypothetical protein PBI_DINODARYN_37 [Gordonia phage DinoDaryn]QKO02958.1 hypothetical protein SEA_TZGORDON_38 [Gordonia phage TZGordon]